MWSVEVAQSFIQPSLEKPSRISSFSEDHVLKLNCSNVEKAFPCDQSEPLLFQFMSTIHHPSAMHHCEEPGPIFSVTFPQVWAGCC